ncbi:unnamed protein product [Adineta ricciae]|uniref:Pentapeptide repeat-containing protein n=1 Tax=Adineta ricciae TaxID=249248 RepID=A0A815MHC6_ADIRI|nr:unnamed protein product [Adineta ricciae]
MITNEVKKLTENISWIVKTQNIHSSVTMISQENATQTEQTHSQNNKFCSLTIQNILQFISSLILPLMLGIFTVVITLHQQNISMKQRREDHEIARNQRLEDRNESHLQRVQELHVLAMQYEIDRNMSNDRYKDEILSTYMRNMGELFERNNGSLTCNPTVKILARAKTLNAIRQLDGSHNMHVIRFLFESGQLFHKNECPPLDISTALLVNLEFGSLTISPEIEYMILTGVFFIDCTFHDMTIESADFTLNDVYFANSNFMRVDFMSTAIEVTSFLSAKLNLVWFQNSELDEVNFSYAELSRVNFSEADLKDILFLKTVFDDVDFSDAELENIEFHGAFLRSTDFLYTEILKSDFTFSELENIDFSYAEIKKTDFSYAGVRNTDFSESTLVKIDFSHCALHDIDFSSADLSKTDFLDCELAYIDFSQARLKNVNFFQSTMLYVDFSSVEQLRTVNFSSSKLLNNISFASSRLDLVSFHYALMVGINFSQSNCEMVNFDYANLSMSIFSYANAQGASFKNADLTDINFSFANLRKADFTNTSITVSQLRSALSIRDSQLPDGTLGRDSSWIKNGHADCNISFLNHWQLHKDNYNLTSLWMATFLKNFRAILSARMTKGVIIQLTGTTNKSVVLDEHILNSTQI